MEKGTGVGLKGVSDYPTSLINSNGGWLENKSPYMDPNYIPADQTRGLNSAQTQMVSQIAQSTGDIGVDILTGVMQKKDNERARNEARELSEIARQDKLKQQNIEISFRKKKQEQEEQQFQLQQAAAMFNQRLSIWQNTFKRNYENMMKSRQAAEELWNELSQVDENKRKELLRGFI